MFSTILCAAMLAVPSSADRLDELIERSRSLQSFSGAYTLTFEVKEGARVKPPPTSEIRIDVVAPDRVRVSSRSDGQEFTTWCAGSLVASQTRTGTGGRGDTFGAADARALRAGLEPLREHLDAAFPAGREARRDDEYDGPSALVKWSFDTSAQRANFDLSAASVGLDSPLGWLDILRRKGAVLAEEGDVLRFETDDGHFHGELDASDGVLRLLQGESPNGRFFLRLTSRELEPLDASQFAPPSATPGARDTSAELRSGLLRSLLETTRLRAYRGVAKLARFDDSARSRARAWLSEFHAHVLDTSLASWFELAERKRTTIAERLEAYAASGRTPQQVEEQRQKELASLRKGLDELEASFAGLIALSASQRGLAHASDFNAVEEQVFAATFDERVRKRAVSELEAATKRD